MTRCEARSNGLTETLSAEEMARIALKNQTPFYYMPKDVRNAALKICGIPLKKYFKQLDRDQHEKAKIPIAEMSCSGLDALRDYGRRNGFVFDEEKFSQMLSPDAAKSR